jgi:hypothetical protein
VASDPDRRQHQTVTRGRNSRGAAAKLLAKPDRTTKTHGAGHLPGLIALFKLDPSVGAVLRQK